MAEDTGFEPADPFGSMVFKTTAFDHSANPPHLGIVILRESFEKCNIDKYIILKFLRPHASLNKIILISSLNFLYLLYLLQQGSNLSIP